MLPKQGRGTSRKHVIKPFTQPAAPDCTTLHVATMASRRYSSKVTVLALHGDIAVSFLNLVTS